MSPSEFADWLAFLNYRRAEEKKATEEARQKADQKANKSNKQKRRGR